MNLTIFVKDSISGANEMANALAELPEAERKQVQDAAIVIRKPDGASQLSHCAELIGKGDLGGIFWGVLFSLIYWSRWWGLNIGGALNDLGLDDEFIKEVSQVVTKNHSALFILAGEQATQAVNQKLGPFNPEVIGTTLDERDYQRLRMTFSPG